MGNKIKVLYLNQSKMMAKSKTDQSENAHQASKVTRCPHCGVKLSSWQQVLLNVDRALMCKHCWYRIILDVGKPGQFDSHKSEEKP